MSEPVASHGPVAQKVQQASVSLYHELVVASRDSAFHHARKKGVRIHDAEDIAQEATLAILVRSVDDPVAYCVGAARHLVVNVYRERQHVPLAAVAEPEVPAARREASVDDALAGCVCALSRVLREVIQRVANGEKIKQIAAQARVSEATVRQRLSRARRLCAACLRRHGVRCPRARATRSGTDSNVAVSA